MKHLFYVSQLYSLSILRPIQAAARSRGDSCAWFFDQPGAGADHLFEDEQLLVDAAAVKVFNPDAVYVPGNVVPDFFSGVKVQVFHGLATDDTGKKGHYRIRGFFDLYCTRGDAETHKFQALAEQHGHFRVAQTGWPKLDPLYTAGAGRDLRAELGIDAQRPVILFGSTFSPSLTAAPHLYTTIRELAQRGDWFWLVTLHPKTDLQLVAKYRALEGDHLKFFEAHEEVLPLQQTADAMLCDTSSIAIEFQLLGKPLVTFRGKCPGPQQLDVSSVEEVAPALERALQRPPELIGATRRFAEGIHPFADGCSSQRVLEAVDAFLAAGRDGLRPKPLNLWRRLKLRRKLGYYHVR
ncbi:MAG: CDP-glycerol glycerophosphotransferase [Desulfuromonas sp.]|nr:MAG: CDP-glycerol glycerophosphotransferase [Desulfuromonas sp.]